MLTEEYVRNLKPQKENKKIEMSVARAKVIAAVLTKNDFENSFKELLEEQFDKHQKEIRRIRTLKTVSMNGTNLRKKSFLCMHPPECLELKTGPKNILKFSIWMHSAIARNVECPLSS